MAFFILGLGTGAFWYYRATRPVASQPQSALSESTRNALKALDSPVEIRFYSLLDKTSVPESLNDFAGRVNQLISEYPSEADGKISVNRYDTPSDAAATAASADGIKPFNLEKGDACYLGIAVIGNGQRESLPRLAPEWEQALEFDLTRAIVRVAGTKSAPAPTAELAKSEAAAAEDVKRMIPNLDSVSVEEGTRMIHAAALEEFKAAAAEMEGKLKEAQQLVIQAQDSPSEASQQAALKQLQQVQGAQTEKLQQIAARAKARVAALEQLKKPGK